MLYKYNDKYYIKVEQYYVEVELVFKNNDVDLKPTYKKIQIDKNEKLKEFNFLSSKKELVEEHNNKKDAPVVETTTDAYQQNTKRTRKY